MSQAARRHPPRGSIDRMLALTQLQRPRPRSAYVRLTSIRAVWCAQKAAIHRRRGARVKSTQDGPRAVSPPHARWLARRKAKKLGSRPCRAGASSSSR